MLRWSLGSDRAPPWSRVVPREPALLRTFFRVGLTHIAGMAGAAQTTCGGKPKICHPPAKQGI